MLIVNARFLTQQLTGVQRFAIEIAKQLQKELKDQVLFVAPRNIINREVADMLKPVIVGNKTGYYWEQIELPRYLQQHGNPFILNLCGMAPIFYKNKAVVLHDIQFVRYPQMFKTSLRLFYRLIFPTLLRRSKHVFSVSQFSVNDIAAHYGIDKRKMSVVYNAPADCFRPVEDSRLRERKYLFAVSSVKANKNFLTTLKAFENASCHCPDLYLYIAGNMDAAQFRNVDLSTYRDNPKIKWLGHISDDQLVRYYSNAFALLFPSFFEGFGLPVIEAQACGCPVICSNATSLPEVAADSALMGNPNSVADFEQAILRLYNNPSLRHQLITKGHQNTHRFTWEKSLETMLPFLS